MEAWSALRLCIAPVQPEELFRVHWERRPLVVLREGGARRFAGLISSRRFDAIVACSNLRYPFFRLFRGGELIPPRACTTARQVGSDVDAGLADLNVVYDQVAAGATIVLQAVERSFPPVTAFCRQLERELGHPVQAYIYLSPPHAQGAPAHYDTHDVFVLQVEGRKTWRIWGNPRPLPLRRSQDRHDPAVVHREVTTRRPAGEITLRAGDSLYLPRGYIHEAVTSGASSLHISIGVMVHRWIDVLAALTDEALARCRADARYRQSLPAGRRPGDPPGAAEKDAFERMLSSFLTDFDVDRGLRHVHERFVTSRAPSNRGRLLALERLEAIRGDTVLRRRPDVIAALEETSGAVLLRVSGAALRFEPRHAEALRFAVAAFAFRVSALPGRLDARERIALAKELVASGFLMPEQAAPRGGQGE